MKLKDERLRISRQNIFYYDQIAGRYNAMMDKETFNRTTRQTVAEKFRQLIPSGSVLDFGGGTGLDLKWMTSQGYSVIFCEPSFKMRDEAISYNNSYLQNKNIIFLDDLQADFRNWTRIQPFSPKVDGILANFAVLNCIPDLALLFKNLAQPIKPGAHFLALVLDNGWKKILRSHPYRMLRNLVLGEPVHFRISFEENVQVVYVHTMREIKKASAAYFNISKLETIPASGFVLIHLIRK